ncbi:MAG: D-alanyl-D-alanine carboxypeptidase family protein [Chloroflexota bacterium]
MRRSEAILLFLFVATAVVFFATRAVGPAAGPRSALAAAAPLLTPTAVPTPTDVPQPTPTPLPPYFSATWLAVHPPTSVPNISAKGAIVIDLDSQQIMFQRASHISRPPASIMKIMTAMVTLDHATPEQMLTVSPSAAAVEPNHMGVTAGEQLPVKDLLYGMLLDSGNDAAETLAQGLAGGRSAFIQAMNEKAVRLGLAGTRFVDPSGLDDQDRTTPYDMAVMADAALTGYPTFRAVVSTKKIVIPSTPTHKWFSPTNLNELLWDYPGTYGVKVGYTDAAGYTIVLACQRNGRHLMVVLMGSKAHFTEGRELLDWAFSHLPVDPGPPARPFPTNVQKGLSPA